MVAVDPKKAAGLLVLVSSALVALVVISRSGTDSPVSVTDTSHGDFTEWLSRYEKADDKTNTALVSEGVMLAKARKASVLANMKADPKNALESAIDEGVRDSLPTAVAEHVEEFWSGNAKIHMYMPLQKDHTKSDIYSLQMDNGDRYAAYVYGRRRYEGVQKSTPLWGIRLDRAAVVADSPLRPLPAGTAVDPSLPVYNSDMIDPVSGKAASPGVSAVLGGSIVFFENYDNMAAFVDELVLAEHRAGAEARVAFRNDASTSVAKVAVLILYWPNEDSSEPTDPATFQRTLDISLEYWSRQSKGCSDWEVEFLPTIEMSTSRDSLSYGDEVCPISLIDQEDSAMDDEVWSIATTMGYDENDYDRYILVFNEFDSCAWFGLAGVAAAHNWINGYTYPYSWWHVVGHELGHNYGLVHSNLWVADDRDSPIGDGTDKDYGSDFDLMGANPIAWDRSTFDIMMHKKVGLEWVSDDDVAVIDPDDCTAGVCTSRIYAHDHPLAEGNRAVKIERPTLDSERGTTWWYWFELRTLIDYPDAQPYFANGLMVHLVYDKELASSYEEPSMLLDMTPKYVSDKDDDARINNAPLMVGTTYYDADIDTYMTPTARGTNEHGVPWMDLSVFKGTGTNVISSGSITASCDSAGIGETIAFTVSGLSQTSATSHLAYAWSFGDSLYGEASNARVTHAYAAKGTYTVRVVVSDLKGETHSLTTKVKVSGSKAKCGACSSCSADHGTCAGGVCVCAANYSTALSATTSCSTKIWVKSITPAYTSSLSPSGESTVVALPSGTLPASPKFVCRFTPLADTTGTAVTGTATVTCPLPDVDLNERTTVHLEISPNGGVDWTDTRKEFTFGGGSCSPSCVSGKGTCGDDGLCHCNVGQTGDNCNTAHNLDRVLPAVGPSVGGLLTRFDLSALGSGYDCGAITVVWSGNVTADDGGTEFYYETAKGTYSSSGYVWAVSPAGPSGEAVSVSVSLNWGKDWSTSRTFTFQTYTTLYNNRDSVSTVTGTGYRFLKSFHGDPDVPFSVRVVASSNNPNMVFSRKYFAPTAACTDAYFGDYVHCYTASGSDVATVPDDFAPTSDAPASIGPIFATVVSGSAAQTAGYTATYTTDPADATLHLTGNATGSAAGVVPISNSLEYTFDHPDDGMYSVVTVTISASAIASPFIDHESVVLKTKKGSTTTTWTNLTATIPNCASHGTYIILLTADSAVPVTVDVTRYEVPVQPNPLTVLSRTTTSIEIEWEAGWSPIVPESYIRYYVYARKSPFKFAFNSSCGAMDLGKKVGGPFTSATTKFEYTDLKPGNPYDFNVVMHDTYHDVYGAMPFLIQRTIPEDIPLGVLWGMVGLIIGCEIIATAFMIWMKYNRKTYRPDEDDSDERIARMFQVQGIVLQDFEPDVDTKGEMRVRRGEVVVLCGQPDRNGWILAFNDRNEKGVIPWSHVFPHNPKYPTMFKAVVHTAFDAHPKHPGELSVNAMEFIWVFGRRPDFQGWIKAKNMAGEYGIVPFDFIKIRDNEPASIPQPLVSPPRQSSRKSVADTSADDAGGSVDASEESATESVSGSDSYSS